VIRVCKIHVSMKGLDYADWTALIAIGYKNAKGLKKLCSFPFECKSMQILSGEGGISSGPPATPLIPGWGRQTIKRSTALRALFVIPVRFGKRACHATGNNKCPLSGALLLNVCGEGGIRTPGSVTFNSFQDCRNRPLCHLSGRKIRVSA
jgi:hypothetical protein